MARLQEQLRGEKTVVSTAAQMNIYICAIIPTYSLLTKGAIHLQINVPQKGM